MPNIREEVGDRLFWIMLEITKLMDSYQVSNQESVTICKKLTEVVTTVSEKLYSYNVLAEAEQILERYGN